MNQSSNPNKVVNHRSLRSLDRLRRPVTTTLKLLMGYRVLKYQFRIEITFHFNEHREDRRRWFMFGDDCHRRVPVEMEGVEGLNTIGMFVEKPGTFHQGHTCQADCVVIAPELFKPVIKPGTKGRLWDCGFFADVEVLKVYEEGWPEN